MKKQKRALSEEEMILHEKRVRFKPQPGHAMPVTRREFIALGLLQSSAYMFLPSALSMIGRSAFADTSSLLANPPAFLEIDAAGGPAFMSNVAMTDVNRALLPSYDQCGQGSLSVAQGNIATMFSNKVPMFKTGGIYKGLTSVLPGSDPLYNKAVWLNLATNTTSDSNNNEMSAMGLVQSAIAAGPFLPSLKTRKQINLPAYLQAPSALVVDQYQTLIDSISPRSTDTFGKFTSATRSSILRAVTSLNASQVGKFSNVSQGASLSAAVTDAQTKVDTIFNSTSLNFDPRTDANMSKIWGLSTASVTSVALQEAAVINALVKGYATSAALLRNGYDYHGSPRATTDALDFNLGVLIGQVLLSFKAANKPVFISITTDGQIGGDASEVANGSMWTGDRNFNSVTYILAYNPTSGVNLVQYMNKPETQIGQFNAAQGSDITHAVASARGVATAAHVNYLAFAGVNPIGHASLAPVTLGSDQIAQLVKIKT